MLIAGLLVAGLLIGLLVTGLLVAGLLRAGLLVTGLLVTGLLIRLLVAGGRRCLLEQGSHFRHLGGREPVGHSLAPHIGVGV